MCFLFEKIDFRTLFSLALAFQVFQGGEEKMLGVVKEGGRLKLKRTFQQLLLKC